MAPPKRLASGAARAFARRYMEVVEALQQQGVPTKTARDEARLAATLVFLSPEYMDRDEPCPTCGRKDE